MKNQNYSSIRKFCHVCIVLITTVINYLNMLEQVKPVLSRLKLTLVTLAASILACVLVILYIDGGQIQEAENRVIRGVYNDDSARSFEPDAFCGEPGPPQ